MEKKISCKRFLIKIYEIYYRNIVRDEIELAEIKSNDKILCIGGGSIPCTAMEIANHTKAKVDVIDIDSKAVYISKAVVKRMGFGNQIQIKKAKGEDIDVEDYNVIHIALQVTPKEEVVKNIWDRSKLGTKIVVRMPKPGLRVFYSNLSEKLSNRSNIKSDKVYLRNRLNTMEEILLMVKD